MADFSLAKYLYQILTNDKMQHRKAMLLQEWEKTNIGLLWNILFETDIRDTEILKERIFRYGSSLKEQDYLGRELFLCLVASLNLVIK